MLLWRGTRMDEPRQQSIEVVEGFWAGQFAYYLHEHRDPRNRLMHMLGIPILIVTLIASAIMLDWRMFLGGQLLGWAIQMAGHKLEGSRPAFLHNPVAFVMGPLMVLEEMAERGGVKFAFADRARDAISAG